MLTGILSRDEMQENIDKAENDVAEKRVPSIIDEFRRSLSDVGLGPA